MTVRNTFRQILVVAAPIALFAAGGHLAATAVIDGQRSHQAADLTDVVLRRAENSIDSAVTTLREIAARGPLTCDPAALQGLRLQVYQRSAIKDFRSVDRDGTVLCSAYSETLEFDVSWTTRDEMLPTQASGLHMFKIPQFDGVAVGVLLDVDERSALVAVLGFNSFLFDVLPAGLREYGEVKLELTDGKVVGSFDTAARPQGSPDDARFSEASQRYPLRAQIAIARPAFSAWNS